MAEQPPVDVLRIENITNGDKEFQRELLVTFLEEAAQQIAFLEISLQRNDVKLIQNQAHSLKSASGSIGAKHLSHLSLTLEQLALAQNMTEAEKVFLSLKEEFEAVKQFLMTRFLKTAGD